MTFKSSTRTFLELRVGRTHVIDVVLHVRRQDAAWFHSSSDKHKKEVLQLLSEQILPKECAEEIEEYHGVSHTPSATIIIGEKNRKGKKRKQEPEPPPKQPERPKRDIRHAFAENVRVTLRVEPVKANGATLLFPRQQDDSSPQKSNFRRLQKLSKRIVLWCYPLDKNNPTAPTRDGFPRPEMIPITSLFRPPPREERT